MKSFCWPRNHITAFVDGFCKVPDTKQDHSLLWSNGRFIPRVTWHLGAHLHSRHLHPARSDTHGQFRNDQRLPHGGVFPLTNYGLRAPTAIKLRSLVCLISRTWSLQGPTCSVTTCFSLKEQCYKHTLSILKTLRRKGTFQCNCFYHSYSKVPYNCRKLYPQTICTVTDIYHSRMENYLSFTSDKVKGLNSVMLFGLNQLVV